MNIKKLFAMGWICLTSFLQATIIKNNNLDGSITYYNTDNMTTISFYPQEKRYSGYVSRSDTDSDGYDLIVTSRLPDFKLAGLFNEYGRAYQSQEAKKARS